MKKLNIDAEPGSIAIDPKRTAIVMIDMQRDFLEPGGFGETLGNDVSLLAKAIQPAKALLTWARKLGMLIVHTREGHRPDMADAPPAKVERGAPSMRIGDPGAMGRILIRGEAGHDIIPELAPLEGEPVIDKPGKGAFYATDLQTILQNRRIENLIVGGVTTEHLTAQVNIANVLNDLSKVVASTGSTGAAGATAGDALSLVESAITSAQVDIYTGVTDHIVRKFDLAIAFTVPQIAAGALGGLSGGSLNLDVTLTQLGQAQTITAPANPQPSSKLLNGVFALESQFGSLASLASLASGGSSGG